MVGLAKKLNSFRSNVIVLVIAYLTTSKGEE